MVDGRQMVSLVSVHGRGSLFDVNGLLHLVLCQLYSRVRTLVLFMAIVINTPKCICANMRLFSHLKTTRYHQKSCLLRISMGPPLGMK